ncbi:hypothetical protein [Acuticoccus sp.]|uniref:hypothetical protein n=1 Tax=Acuticoccus sp. TaxID=1904378 RepID=UPI003B51713F
MARADTVRELLEAHGQTFCDELRIPIAKNQPSALFRWLTACILYANRIQHHLATQSARELSKAGWRTAKAMAEADWDARVKALNAGGFAQYQERTATILGDASEHLISEYGGDLRRMREAADGDVGDLRRRLKVVKGMGDVAVDIFFREAQEVWDEIHPFADKLALKAAERHGLGADAAAIAKHVDRKDYVRLIAALTRDELER